MAITSYNILNGKSRSHEWMFEANDSFDRDRFHIFHYFTWMPSKVAIQGNWILDDFGTCVVNDTCKMEKLDANAMAVMKPQIHIKYTLYIIHYIYIYSNPSYKWPLHAVTRVLEGLLIGIYLKKCSVKTMAQVMCSTPAYRCITLPVAAWEPCPALCQGPWCANAENAENKHVSGQSHPEI